MRKNDDPPCFARPPKLKTALGMQQKVFCNIGIRLQVLEKHKVDAATGLSNDEVQARERIHGPNEMEEGEQVSYSVVRPEWVGVQRG